MRNVSSRLLAATALVFALASPATLPARAGVVVPTQHNDNRRTGANLAETALTPQTVAANRLRRVGRKVDGWMYGQVLYAPGVVSGGAKHDVAYVATTNDTVYAFDANDASADENTPPLWQTSLPLPAGWHARGIISTPVLEYANGAGTIDVVYSVSSLAFPYSFDVFGELLLKKFLHLQVRYYVAKLDLANGTIVKGPVELTGSARRSDGSTLAFDPANETDNPALLLDHGYLYVSFGARQNENVSEYYGWMLRYRADTLAPSGAFNVSPNAWLWPYPGDPPYDAARSCYSPREGRLKPWTAFSAPIPRGGVLVMECVAEGGGIWQGGAGPAADGDGNVYVLTGNGHYAPGEHSYANAVVKLLSTPDMFEPAGSFAPSAHREDLEVNDVDLGSAGPVLAGDDAATTSVIAGGKTGIFYVLDPSLRKRQEIVAGVSAYSHGAQAETDRYETWNVGPHFHGSPTLWRISNTRSYVYQWAEKDYLKKYVFENGFFGAPGRAPWIARGSVLAKNCEFENGRPVLGCIDAMPGGMLTLTANGTRPGSGIVWALLRSHDANSVDAIYAFDADSLRLLWSDAIGAVPHFAEPTVADGKVFVPTNTSDFKLYIYRLGSAARPASRTAGGRRPWRWPGPGATMSMMRSPGRSKLQNYAADPMFQARLLIADVQPPRGMIARASYAVRGTEVYTCFARAQPPRCAAEATRIEGVYDYDDRTSTASIAPAAGVPANAARVVGTSARRAVRSRFPGAADWERLDHPGGVFGSAPYVVRTKTAGGAPPAAPPRDGEYTVPFTAVYTAFDVRKR